jgi:hypothetical protein
MSRRNRFRGFVAVLTILLALSMCSQGAQGIGVTPGRKTIDFEPNFEGEFSFAVLNSDHKDMKALLYVEEGEFSDIVTLYNALVDFSAGEDSKTFRYRVTLPEQMEKPGNHDVKIVIRELPKDVENPGTFVGATTAVIHQVRIKVPYTGKYAEIGLEIADAQPGETVNFFVKTYNIGTQEIARAKATIEIRGPTNEVIDTVETEEKAIASNGRSDLTAHWQADVNPGIYHAVAVLDYDGKVARDEKNFYVGNLFIDVKDITVKGFRLGGVAKFNIMVESKWNERIEGVYGEMIITDLEGDVIANVKSASVDVEAFQEQVLLAYWDTEGVEKGVYDASLVLHYAGKTTERKLKTYIELESLTTEIIGVTARAVRREEGGPDILTPLVIVLIMVNVGWFFYFRKRK